MTEMVTIDDIGKCPDKATVAAAIKKAKAKWITTAEGPIPWPSVSAGWTLAASDPEPLPKQDAATVEFYRRIMPSLEVQHDRDEHVVPAGWCDLAPGGCDSQSVTFHMDYAIGETHVVINGIVVPVSSPCPSC